MAPKDAVTRSLLVFALQSRFALPIQSPATNIASYISMNSTSNLRDISKQTSSAAALSNVRAAEALAGRHWTDRWTAKEEESTSRTTEATARLLPFSRYGFATE